MKILSRIPVKYVVEKYQVDIEYATPEKISVFELIILEIIKNYPDKDKAIKEILLELDFSEQMFYLFEKVIQELKYAKIISADIYDNNFIEYPLEFFTLTQVGEKVYRTKERISKTYTANVNLGYDYFYHKVLTDKEIERRKERREKSLLIDYNFNDIEEEIKKYAKINAKQIIQKHYTEKTEILDIITTYIEQIEISDSIDIILRDKQISFYHENLELLEAFQKVRINLREIYPVYRNIKQSELNFSEKIKIYENQKYNLKVAIICDDESKEAFISDIDNYFYLSALNKDFDFNFIGLTYNNKYLIFKYKVFNVEGYEIPLYEVINQKDEYDKVLGEVITSLDLPNLNLDQFITITFLIRINDKRKEFVKGILKHKSNTDSLEFLEKYKEFNELQNIVSDIAIEYLLNSIKQKVAIEEIIDFANKFNIQAENFYEEILKNYPINNDLIKALLENNEEYAIKIFDLGNYFFQLLKNNSLENNEFNCQLFNKYLLIEKELKNIEKYVQGFKLINLPNTDDEWEQLNAHINNLQSLGKQIEKYLNEENKKEFWQFIEDFKDLYYENKEITINFDDKEDIRTYYNKKLKEKDWIALAARLRLEIENKIKKLEEEKGISGLKGYQRIHSVFGENADKIYEIWRFLNQVLHDKYEYQSIKKIRKKFNDVYKIIKQYILEKAEKQDESKQNADVQNTVKNENLETKHIQETEDNNEKHKDSNIKGSNNKDKSAKTNIIPYANFAILEFSTKAIKLLIGPTREYFEQNGFNFKDFVRVTEFTETGKCFMNNTLDLKCLKSKLLPAIKKLKKEIKEKTHDSKKYYYAYATGIYRLAENRDEIIKFLNEKSGIKLKILSEEGEATATLISYLFTRKNNNDISGKHILLIDQGGASTEISLFRQQELIDTISLETGTTFLEQLFFENMNITIDEALKNVEKYSYEYLKDKMRTKFDFYRRYSPVICVGAGSTITKASNKPNNKSQHGTKLSIKKLRDRQKQFILYLKDKVESIENLQRLIKEDKNKEIRKRFTAALGLSTYIYIMEKLNIDSIEVNATGLRYGLYFQHIFNLQN